MGKSNHHFNQLQHLGTWLLSAVLPSSCMGCEVILPPEEGLGLCSECWEKLPRWDKVTTPEPMLPEYVDSFNAPFLYEESIDGLVKTFKFQDAPEYAPALARLMCQHLPEVDNPLILPVPIHRWRLWNRGFNQSDLLAFNIAKQTATPFSRTALLRIKHTPKQTGKSKKQRHNILRSAFWADEAQVKGREVILIDDVWTTGSTAHVCAKQLKKAGAEKVHVVTLCYTPI